VDALFLRINGAGRTTFHKDHNVEDIQLKQLVLSGRMSATCTFVRYIIGQSNGHQFKCIKLPFLFRRLQQQSHHWRVQLFYYVPQQFLILQVTNF